MIGRSLSAMSRRDPVTLLIVAAALACAVLVTTGAGGIAFTRDLGNLTSLVMSAVAGTACLVRAVRRPGRMRSVWVGIGLGTLSYALGEAQRIWFETVRHQEVPFPSTADLAHLGMVPLLAAGLLMVPVAQQSLANRMRSVVDGMMIATSLLLVSWLFVIRPLLAEGSDTVLGLYVVLAYPISDIVLVTVVLHMLAMVRRGAPESRPLMLIGTAVLVIGATDTAYAYLTLETSYVSAGLHDVGWFAGFALILLAARRPDRVAANSDSDGTDDRQPFAILLPYTAVVGSLVICTVWYSIGGGGGPFSIWCRSVLILLIVGRQMFTLLENRHLTAYLEARVAYRTAELSASERRFQALVQQSSDSVAVVDPDSTIRYQSESIERIFGYTAATLVGRKLTEVAGCQAAPRIAAALESVSAEPYASTVVEVLLRHHDGRLCQAEMTVTNLLDDPSVNGLVLNTRDIQDAKELQDQLVHEAYHDGLTGLASRALFREKLEGALEVCKRLDDVAVLFLDLDGFKEVNDSLGHAAGDQLLVQVADRLGGSVRGGHTVARFGGDEFAVLVESIVARADAETLARRIVETIGEPFSVGDRDLHVGASVGLASAADANDIEQLLRNADLAMYKAKAAGGHGVASYDPQMHDVLMDRLELEADLRVALDRGELVLHYQPTVDLRTGEIVGFEALVRWCHPTRGIVSPLDFIGIAEATGLVVPLGRWVIAEACRQAVRWGAGTTRRLKMAVNVSVRQFDHTDLAATVAEVLGETGMPADQLCLEMTESVLLTDTDENLTQLLRLKALGVILAMDDFGTGYSSLAYLRRFPMDVLKIDRSFVDRLGGDSEDVALVRTIVRLGQSLGMVTVAEGIEDTLQLAALREMGCDLAQGYFLSQPVPAADAGQLLEHGLAVTSV